MQRAINHHICPYCRRDLSAALGYQRGMHISQHMSAEQAYNDLVRAIAALLLAVVLILLVIPMLTRAVKNSQEYTPRTTINPYRYSNQWPPYSLNEIDYRLTGWPLIIGHKLAPFNPTDNR